jgi:Ribonuclease D
MRFAKKITSEELDAMEIAAFAGDIKVISTQNEDFEEAIEYLSSQHFIGFDTETKPCFIPKVPRNRMAILQLATHERAFIFRLQQLGVPNKLAELMSNPFVMKIGAAVHDDIKGLQGYTQFTPKGFIDMQKLCDEFGIEEKSVRKMAAIILGVRVSKSQQLSNWESSQLSDAQLRYASTDAWVCLRMYEELKAKGFI